MNRRMLGKEKSLNAPIKGEGVSKVWINQIQSQ
jgi:hypothetical protein